MRKIIYFSSCALTVLSSITFSQGYFPLQKGNLWQYSEIPYPIETTQVLGDTILPNGNTYTVCSGYGLPSKFLRQAGAKVYGVDSQGNELAIIDFAANVSDVVSVNGSTLDTIRLIEKDFNFGDGQNYWIFSSTNYTVWRIIDSLGIFQMIFEPGVQLTLRGARINGIVRYGTITSVTQEPTMLPVGISLMQNYPNPFNPSTAISFRIPSRSFVSLKVFDLIGREVATIVSEEMSAGSYTKQWNAEKMSSGIYFYRLQAGSSMETKKLVLLK
jgi:Secretion system C-terminal sorting domain